MNALIYELAAEKPNLHIEIGRDDNPLRRPTTAGLKDGQAIPKSHLNREKEIPHFIFGELGGLNL